MKKRYRVKRGRRADIEPDVMIYEGKTLKFVGQFYPPGYRKLKDDELTIIVAIKHAVEEL